MQVTNSECLLFLFCVNCTLAERIKLLRMALKEHFKKYQRHIHTSIDLNINLRKMQRCNSPILLRKSALFVCSKLFINHPQRNVIFKFKFVYLLLESFQKSGCRLGV